MKKSININLFGTLYAIDEDACKLLENYLDNMKSYFAKREGGDEIADDIEHRVAEHLWTLKEQGRDAIDIETVKQIISSIGNPSEVDVAGDEAEDTAGTAANTSDACAASADHGSHGHDTDGKGIDRVLSHVKTHRFYRDGKDKIAGGVVSGLSHYCGGGDIVVWRVCAVLFVLAAFTLNQMTCFYGIHRFLCLLLTLPFVLYVALWLLAPVARTAEERLCMTGEGVTPESISRALIAEADEDSKSAAPRRHGGTVMSRFFEIVKFCAKLALIVAFAVMAAFALAYLVCGVIYSIVGEPFLMLFNDSQEEVRMVSSIPLLGMYWIISAVCWLAVALLPLLGTVRSFRSGRKPIGFAAVATLVGTWIVAATVGILLFVLLGIHVKNENMIIDRQQNTRNGIYLNRWTWENLDAAGWTVGAARNVAYGSLFAGSDADPLQLDERPFCVSPGYDGKPLALSLSRRQSVAAGEYTLECMSICNVMDATLSVWSGGKCLAMLRLDGYGAANDCMLKDFDWTASRNVPLFCEQGDSTAWVDNVSQVNNGWHCLVSKPFRHDGGTLEYRLRVGLHDVRDATPVGSEVWMAHVTLRKSDNK